MGSRKVRRGGPGASRRLRRFVRKRRSRPRGYGRDRVRECGTGEPSHRESGAAPDRRDGRVAYPVVVPFDWDEECGLKPGESSGASRSVIASGSTAVPRVPMKPRLYEKPTGWPAAFVLGLRATRDALYRLSRTHRLDTVHTRVRLLSCRTDDPTLHSTGNEQPDLRLF
jgi:hypothetical protein